jgi:hypothetical protein
MAHLPSGLLIIRPGDNGEKLPSYLAGSNKAAARRTEASSALCGLIAVRRVKHEMAFAADKW